MAKERAIGNSAVVPSKVVGRMVGHYTRPLRLSPKQSPVKLSKPEIPKKPSVISLKRSAVSVNISTKKARRVPPEEEGAYKIKMPSGTTERTRKILQQQQYLQGTKRSVFSRLGDSAVSSSTDLAKPSSSVFERLGPSSKNTSDDTPTSTVLGETNKVRVGPPLQYQGVLKIKSGNRRIVSSGNGTTSNRTVIKPLSLRLKSPTKTINVNRINNILQSSSGNRSQGIFSHTKTPPKIGIQSRLGAKVDARNLARTKILLRASSRLGAKKTSNVFDRLGK